VIFEVNSASGIFALGKDYKTILEKTNLCVLRGFSFKKSANVSKTLKYDLSER
jgi:hypothetical protein